MFCKVSLILFLLTMGQLAFSQTDTIKLPLKKQIGNGPFKGGLRATHMDSTIEIRRVPASIKDYIIKYIYFRYNPLEKTVSNSIKIKLYFLVGFKSDSLVIIADLNKNLNFSDDKLLLYPKTSDTTKPLPIINYNFFLGEKYFKYTMQPYPYPTAFKFFSKKEAVHYLMIKTYEYRITKKFINDAPIYLINSIPSPIMDMEAAIEIALVDNKGEFKYYSLGDNFIKGDSRYIFYSVNPAGDTLTLIETPINSDKKGYSQGLTIEPLIVKDLKGDNFEIPIKNKFILIDFWGTWCGPCIELIPDLGKLHEKYKNLVIVSIACLEKNKEVVKKAISKYKMDWVNLYDPLMTTHTISDLFNINSYPTTLLIDPEGKILFRGGSKDFPVLKQILKKKLF